MADRNSRASTGETAVGHEGTHLAEAEALQIRRRVQHLLHARTAGGTFVEHDDTITGLDLLFEDELDRGFLAFDDAGTAGEVKMGGIESGRITVRPIRC